MTGINGLVYVASTLPPWYVVDRWGRRPILLSGAVVMTVALSTISYWMYIDVPYTPQMVVLFVIIYNAFFGYSWGPIPWLYPPEIMPLSIRAKGASLSTATNWAFNWLVGEMTPVLQEVLQWRLYLVHALSCAVSFVVVYFLYPETKGVMLEDMDAVFGDQSVAPTPASAHASLLPPGRTGSPVSSLHINPPEMGTPRQRSPPRQKEGGVAGLFKGMFGKKNEDQGGSYRRLDEGDDV